MNNIKRFCSCFSILVVCILTNIGIEVKAMPVVPAVPKIEKDIQQNENFVLYSGTETVLSEEIKIADHYSHSSHYSHRSHYSSRY